MVKLPDPLEWVPATRYRWQPEKILSDRGIRQALEHNVVKVEPELDLQKDSTRVQPATLDVKIAEVTNRAPLEDMNRAYGCEGSTRLDAKHISTTRLTENYDFGQPRYSEDPKEIIERQIPMFIFPSFDVRSSVARLGGFIPRDMMQDLHDGAHIEIGNFSPQSHFV